MLPPAFSVQHFERKLRVQDGGVAAQRQTHINPEADLSKQGHSRGFVRSRQMGDCLRRELLYSEKRPRDVLFRAIEIILTEQANSGGLRILSRLTRDAASHARGEARRVGFEFHHWDTASKAVVKAMLCAGALLGPDADPILPGIAAQATPVVGLREHYQDLTEAFLHALFRQFDRDVPIEDMEDRVVILLAQLADRVELRGDTYVARV
jgi:hypothetical protein